MSENLPRRPVARALLLEDMTIRSDGSGRVVESYFAIFDKPAEVRDQDGHYYEVNARSLFTKTLADKGLNFPVFYNHARTLDGTPAGELSLPVGVPVEITPDDKGVFNAVRYLDNPLADSVLGGIRSRAIRGMSYSGHYLKSTKSRTYKRGALPIITRHEVAMREFGPTPIPAHVDAEIIGFRAQQFLADLLAADTDERLRLLQQYEGLSTLLTEPASYSAGTPAGAATLADEPGVTHSARPMSLRMGVDAARIARGMEPRNADPSRGGDPHPARPDR